jgi:hypothetical protein
MTGGATTPISTKLGSSEVTSITSKIRYIEKLAINNSPVLLTAIGVAGTIATAVFTHRAALKADLIIEQHETNLIQQRMTPAGNKEKLQLVWKCYIPPVATGALTIGSIVMANRIGTKRAAAIAAAYTISEKAYSEYRDKVVEKFGETKERNMRDELVQDQVRRNPVSEENFIVTGGGDVMCCDLFSGRYFRSSVEDIKKAVNDTNYQIMHHQSATLTDFYDRVGLPRTDVSDEIGWNFDKLIEIEFTTVMKEDGQPCIAYRFPVHPVRGFHTLH